jgi:transketolase
LHAIGQQARRDTYGLPANPYLLVCAHAGLMTGEDGPTHADPQCLQLLQGNFPPGALISLTPWDANELWPCLVAGLQARPAVLAPFVTRPATAVIDRTALGLPPASAAAQGLYALRRAGTSAADTACVVLQGHGVTEVFVRQVLPEIDRRGLELDVYCVTSAELFERLDPDEQQRIFPEHRARRAMGITGFTLPTLERWVTSNAGRRASLHPFAGGGYLGSGDAAQVLIQAGLDGEAQWRAVRAWIERKARED